MKSYITNYEKKGEKKRKKNSCEFFPEVALRENVYRFNCKSFFFSICCEKGIYSERNKIQVSKPQRSCIRFAIFSVNPINLELIIES